VVRSPYTPDLNRPAVHGRKDFTPAIEGTLRGNFFSKNSHLLRLCSADPSTAKLFLVGIGQCKVIWSRGSTDVREGTGATGVLD
jgi:hypothetical protein